MLGWSQWPDSGSVLTCILLRTVMPLFRNALGAAGRPLDISSVTSTAHPSGIDDRKKAGRTAMPKRAWIRKKATKMAPKGVPATLTVTGILVQIARLVITIAMWTHEH